MNRAHEKTLRSLIGISDNNAVVTDKVRERIERIENRMTRYFGRFAEMQFETIACLVSGLSDEEVFIIPKPEEPKKPSLEERISVMSKGAILIELEAMKVSTTGKEKIDEIRELLIEAVKEKMSNAETKAD